LWRAICSAGGAGRTKTLDVHAPRAYSYNMFTVVETALFQKQWPLYWNEDERGEFAAFIAHNQGPVPW
jgi:hypothetical protein